MLCLLPEGDAPAQEPRPRGRSEPHGVERWEADPLELSGDASVVGGRLKRKQKPAVRGPGPIRVAQFRPSGSIWPVDQPVGRHGAVLCLARSRMGRRQDSRSDTGHTLAGAGLESWYGEHTDQSTRWMVSVGAETQRERNEGSTENRRVGAADTMGTREHQGRGPDRHSTADTWERKTRTTAGTPTG